MKRKSSSGMYKYLLENKKTGTFHIPDLTSNNGEIPKCNSPAHKLTPYDIAKYGTPSRICKKCIRCDVEGSLELVVSGKNVNAYVSNAFNTIFQTYSYNHQPTSISRVNGKSFKFIPANTPWVVSNFIVAKHYLNTIKGIHRPSFVDCGCGIGNILFIAKEIFNNGSEITGIEFDPDNVDLLNRLIGNHKHKLFTIIYGDLFDVENYGDYDIIYMYRPMNDINSLYRFYRKIINEAKPGCLFIHGSSNTGSDDFHRNKKVKKLFIHYDIFEKI